MFELSIKNDEGEFISVGRVREYKPPVVRGEPAFAQVLEVSGTFTMNSNLSLKRFLAIFNRKPRQQKKRGRFGVRR